MLPLVAPREVELDEISSHAIGAWIFGAGGGGNPYHVLLNLRELCGKGRHVEKRGRGQRGGAAILVFSSSGRDRGCELE